VKDAAADIVKVGEILLDREVKVKGASRAQPVDKAQGISSLEHELSEELVIGEQGYNRELSNLGKVHGSSHCKR